MPLCLGRSLGPGRGLPWKGPLLLQLEHIFALTCVESRKTLDVESGDQDSKPGSDTESCAPTLRASPFSHLAQRLRSDFSIWVFGGKQDKRPLANLNKKGIYLKLYSGLQTPRGSWGSWEDGGGGRGWGTFKGPSRRGAWLLASQVHPCQRKPTFYGFSVLRLYAQHRRPRERNRSGLGPSPLSSAGEEGEKGSPRGGGGDEGASDASDRS